MSKSNFREKFNLENEATRALISKPITKYAAAISLAPPQFSLFLSYVYYNLVVVILPSSVLCVMNKAMYRCTGLV